MQQQQVGLFLRSTFQNTYEILTRELNEKTKCRTDREEGFFKSAGIYKRSPKQTKGNDIQCVALEKQNTIEVI